MTSLTTPIDWFKVWLGSAVGSLAVVALSMYVVQS